MSAAPAGVAAGVVSQSGSATGTPATSAAPAPSSSSSSTSTAASPSTMSVSSSSRVRRLILGVCAMDKKTRSKPMTQILDRLRAYGEFEIIIFGDALILDESISVDAWPVCHCLISFTSKGFPLQRVIDYVRLRKPFCVNDIPSQVVLQDRHDIYQLLEKHRIPTPRHLYVDRRQVGPDGKGAPEVLEFDDHIVIDGVRMDKPLVEKPYDGDDHNIYIYYGRSAGGGSRRLFRKVGNRSSRFYPKVNSLRKTGSYIYESLLLQGKDLKVYTIGPGYAHGELRKSPVVDGVVARDPDQKELRLLTKLTEDEREMARGICVAFKQNICLDAETPIETGCGFSMPIRRVAVGSLVLAYDAADRGLALQPTSQHLDQGVKACVELMFSDGRTIVCTPNHRFMQPDGSWVEAQNMKTGATEISAGVQFPALIEPTRDDESWALLLPALGYSLNMSDRLEHSLAFAGLLGFAGGDEDGNLDFDHQVDAVAVQRDILLLTGQSVPISQETGTLRVVLPQELITAMREVGAIFPSFILDEKCPASVVQAFLGGIFGGDGTTPSITWQEGKADHFTGVSFTLARKCIVSEEQQEATTTQLTHLFERCGLPASEFDIGTNDAAEGITWRLKSSSTLSFAERIGFRYGCHKQHRVSIAAAYYRLHRLLEEQKAFLLRAVAAEETRLDRQLHRGSELHEVLAHAKSELAATQCVHPVIEQWQPQRESDLRSEAAKSSDFLGMDADAALRSFHALQFFSDPRKDGDLSDDSSVDFEQSSVLPTFRVQLVGRRPVGDRHVFDLTVPNGANFLASGLTSHNCGFDIIRTSGQSYVIDVNGWSFVKGNLRYFDKCARIMRKMCLNCVRGREALKLERPLEFMPLPQIAPPTPTAEEAADAKEAATTLATVAGKEKHSRGPSKDTKEREKDREKDAKKAESAATATSAPIPPRVTVSEKVEDATPVSESVATPSALASAAASPAAAVPPPQTPIVSGPSHSTGLSFSSFQLDSSSSPSSLLASPANPKAIGVSWSSNVIADSDNNDVLLGLVAMFRHADRTPKQKVKLNTKSATLMQFFEEQKEQEIAKNKEKGREKEAAAAAAAAASATGGTGQPQMDRKKTTSLQNKSDTPRATQSAAAAADTAVTSSDKDKDAKVAPPAGSSADASTPVAKESKKDASSSFQFKDMKWKKKSELTRIREAVKILLVKEQLREKRKKKAATLALEQAKAQAAEEETQPTPAAITAAVTAAVSTAAADSSEDESDSVVRAAAAVPIDPDADPADEELAMTALDDELLEAAISAEQARSRTKDAQKDPDYMSKLYQIGSVLEKGYGGVKVQLKPKKVEHGKVVQALLIVKWGGEMTHAGVGQAKQYAAAFWDDMIPPPYVNSAAVAAAAAAAKVGPPSKGLNFSHPGATSAYASMANTNADNVDEATAAAAAAAAARLQAMDPERAIQAAMLTDTEFPSSPPVAPTSPAADVSVATPLSLSCDADADSDPSLAASPAAGSSHEFAYDHNSSLTQSDRAKLKSQLQAARSATRTTGSVQSIPEHAVVLPATPKRSNAAAAGTAANSANASALQTDAPESEPTVIASALLPVVSSVSAPSSARKMSRVSSSVISLASLGKDSPSGITIDPLSSPSTPVPASGTTTELDRLSAFRRQRLAFLSGLKIYASDEARVVASAEAFYTSTFEHAHGLGDLTAEQAKDREEKKKISSIKEWIDASRKSHISHDKLVQEYLDDTSMCGESMARAKEGVKFMLMAEAGLTPAQVTRHMLAQEQIARATSEAERADIMKEEEEMLRAARAEAEAREREEQVQVVSLRQQQREEEQMEQLMDRLAELEEDGMNLEAKVEEMREHEKRRLAGQCMPDDAKFNFRIDADASVDPDVVDEIEELLAKIYAKLMADNDQAKKKAKVAATNTSTTTTTTTSATPAPTPAASADASAANATTSSGTNDASAITPVARPCVSTEQPASPSTFGPTAMTEWGVRCLRWIGKPKTTLVKLYELLLQLQVQIHSKCEWAVKNAPIEGVTGADAAPSPNATAQTVTESADVETPAGAGPFHRKMSGGSGLLSHASSSASLASDGGAPPALISSRSLAPSASNSNLLKDPAATAAKTKAATEFEYVYQWEEGDEEIVGKGCVRHKETRGNNMARAGRGMTHHIHTDTLSLCFSCSHSLLSLPLRVLQKIKRTPAARFSLGYMLCHKETLFLMKSRWDSLISSFYDVQANTFDPTKLPDVYDCIKYDVLHNMEFITDIRPLYSAIKRIADFVVPNEYGILRKDKWAIGVGIARPLLQRMIGKLESALSPRCPSRVTLYFSSESHIHALRNVLLLSGIACNRTVATSLDAIELNYLSHAVFRLYEDVSKPIDDPLRYYVNVQFSPGAALDPHVFREHDHTLPVSRPTPVSGRIPFHRFQAVFSSLSFAYPPPLFDGVQGASGPTKSRQ